MLTGIRGRIKKVDQGEDTIVYQVEIDSQTTKECNSMNTFGITSKAPVDSNCIIMSDGTIAFVTATEGLDYEIEVEEGEVAIHNSENNVVTFKKDGSIHVKSDHVVVESEKVEFNGDSREFVTHAELDIALQKYVALINSHTHAILLNPVAAPLPPPAVPVTIPTLVPLTPATLDISASKTEKLYTS